jgi:signal transduction histidine kinase
MLRNREIQILLMIMIFISATIMILSQLFNINNLLILGVTSLLLITTTFIFTRWRYLEIEKLSTYLRRISSGDHNLDVRDNDEGELSILKNDIYKVTIMLTEQGANLKQDKQALTDAISDISHQLKTPLTSMMVMADLLSGDELSDEKRKEFTNNIIKQLERIEWLVSSLLKLSKIDAGTVAFKKELIPIRKVIQKAVDPLLIPIEIKNQNLIIDGNEEVAFLGDLNWTVEALINILKNCIEHTDNGGEISISFNENPLYTEISITDNGKGIPKEDIPFVFKRFYKGKNAEDGSIGIGLAMAQSIISQQNGDIEVFSKLGDGTQFLIKFYKQVI